MQVLPAARSLILTTVLVLLSSSAWAQGQQACATSEVPLMTGPTTPENIVTRSGVYSASYEAWLAFDGNPATQWISEVGQTPAWIGYEWDLGGPRLVSRYAITFANGSLTTRAPRAWTLEASNGGGWVVVDTRTNETNWAGVERREYVVASPGVWRQYRLNITDDNDSQAGIVVVSMSNLEFFGCSCRPRVLVPLMTSPTTPTGVVTRSGAYSASYEAWQAFDRNYPDTTTMWISQVGQTPAWIAYDWSPTDPRFVLGYAITFANGSLTSRAPRSWTVWGLDSMTGAWRIIDTRANETNWGGVERRTYLVAGGSYSKVHLDIKDDNDLGAGIVVVSMSGLEYFGCY